MFARYVAARYAEETERYSFRAYVTDSIILYAKGKCFKTPWREIIRPVEVQDIDAEAVVSDVIARAGLVVN